MSIARIISNALLIVNLFGKLRTLGLDSRSQLEVDQTSKCSRQVQQRENFRTVIEFTNNWHVNFCHYNSRPATIVTVPVAQINGDFSRSY